MGIMGDALGKALQPTVASEKPSVAFLAVEQCARPRPPQAVSRPAERGQEKPCNGHMEDRILKSQ